MALITFLLMLMVTPSPAAASPEVCNGMDDDGDGVVDEGTRKPWYLPARKGDTCREVDRWNPPPPADVVWRCDCPYGYVPACIRS